jgi:murein L,D-transpeptidase YcbB/YkuD
MVKRKILIHPWITHTGTCLLTITLGWIAAFETLSARPTSGEATELLRRRIETSGIPARIIVDGEPVYASERLPVFYERRGYQPAWTVDGEWKPQIGDMIGVIREADREGFEPDDYHLEKIEKGASELRGRTGKKPWVHTAKIVDLDLLLTDAYLVYSAHLLAGRVNPETIDPEWHARRREADLAEILENALREDRIKASLESLLPPQPGYGKLRDTLERYRKMAEEGGWLPLPEGGNLQLGDQGETIFLLRNRLAVTGDLLEPAKGGLEGFDEEMDRAVRRFQARHGLDIDGVVGPATRRALNVRVEERISQIEINMERWRWLPQDLGRRYILVNIANFELDVVEDERNVMTMRIVVGRQYRRTPVFSDRMTYLVLCPYWNIPPGILEKDVLPAVRKDPAYLQKQRIKIFQGWSAESKEIDPYSVDWTKISLRNPSYRFRQDSGPNNSLGRIKFMFPNKFNVYLHDTPTRELFAKSVRTFSSGCIRIEKPIELAEYVLKGDPKWNREMLLAEIDKWSEQTVRLLEPIPVHILYWTSWVEAEGTVHFREDIYGRDHLLTSALDREPPERPMD